MPVTCQYLLAHRSTQLFSPTFKSASLYLPMTTGDGFGWHANLSGQGKKQKRS